MYKCWYVSSAYAVHLYCIGCKHEAYDKESQCEYIAIRRWYSPHYVSPVDHTKL